MDEALIIELQGHFDGRSRLKKVADAIKCYTKDASIYYSYVDGWGNKRNINIPIEPEEILPILENYIKNIEKDIIKIAAPPPPPIPSVNNALIIDNASEINSKVEEYKISFPDTYTSCNEIRRILHESMEYRATNGLELTDSSFQIPVASDWEDKLYLFSFIGIDDGVALFHFDGIAKI